MLHHQEPFATNLYNKVQGVSYGMDAGVRSQDDALSTILRKMELALALRVLVVTGAIMKMVSFGRSVIAKQKSVMERPDYCQADLLIL